MIKPGTLCMIRGLPKDSPVRAAEGLDPELLTPAEVYDRARENLWAYVHGQLELFK